LINEFVGSLNDTLIVGGIMCWFLKKKLVIVSVIDYCPN
jgi:hypothetical protein